MLTRRFTFTQQAPQRPISRRARWRVRVKDGQSSTYSARCETSSSCASEDAILDLTYTVPPAPIVAVTGGTFLCAGESTTLTASGCETGQTVRWSNGQTGQTLILTPTASAYYTAVCLSGEVVSEPSQQVQVTVNNTLSVDGRTSYSIGETISLTAVSSAPGSVTYTWSGPHGFVQAGPVLQIIGAGVSQSGAYTVMAQASQGCAGRQTMVISVTSTAYGIETQPLSQSATCAGGSVPVPFSATGTFNTGNLFTVQLSAADGSFTSPTALGSGAGNPITVTLPTTLLPGSYQLRVVSSDPFVEGTPSATPLTISSAPSVTATNSSPSGQIPVGGPVGGVLSLSATGESAPGQNLSGATYAWTGPDNFASAEANPTLPTTTSASSGLYTVTVSVPGGCTATTQTSVSLVGVTCLMSFDGEPLVGCDSAAADSTRQSRITVKLLNIPAGGAVRISLYQQTTLVATLTGTPGVDSSASFTGLTDGPYRVDAYALTGNDTCRAGTRTLTVRCTSGPLNIRIKAVDATPAETDLLPRVGGGLGTLTLSVEELDGQDLTGYTYLWSEPTSTSAVATTAIGTPTATPTLTARRIGEYKVTLTNAAGDTLVAYTTLRAKPCKQVAHTYQCGTGPAASIIDGNSLPLSSLAPGDTIRTGDFDVIVAEVFNGGNGTFTGVGYTEIPYLKNNKIAVEFKNASVNDCYEYTGGGTVQSAYDPSWFTERTTVPNSASNDDPNGSLAKLQDLLQNFTATNEQKQEIDELLTTLGNQLISDPELTDDQRTAALSNLEQTKVSWDSLKVCSSAGGRIAAQARSAAAGSCSKESVIQNLNQVYTSMTSTLAGCNALRPTTTGVEGQSTTTVGTRMSNTPDGRFPETCIARWYYFSGPTPLLQQMTLPVVTDWSPGWYSHKGYIDRVRRVVKAIAITTGDVKVLAPGTNVAAEVALFDEFVNSRTVSDAFMTSIAADYEGIRRGADFTVTGSGQVEPVNIEFEAFTLLTIPELKGLVRAGVGLAKAGALGAKNAYITARLATQLRLAKVGSDGVLREVQWIEYIDDTEVVSSIELKNVRFVNTREVVEDGNLLIVRLRNNTWKIIHKAKQWISVQKITNKYPSESLPADGELFGIAQINEGLVNPISNKGNTFTSIDFVVTSQGELRLGRKHHLLGNRQSVEAAGTLKIISGKVKSITNWSGHYRPTLPEADNFPLIFRQIGVDLRGTALNIQYKDAQGNVKELTRFLK